MLQHSKWRRRVATYPQLAFNRCVIDSCCLWQVKMRCAASSQRPAKSSRAHQATCSTSSKNKCRKSWCCCCCCCCWTQDVHTDDINIKMCLLVISRCSSCSAGETQYMLRQYVCGTEWAKNSAAVASVVDCLLQSLDASNWRHKQCCIFFCCHDDHDDQQQQQQHHFLSFLEALSLFLSIGLSLSLSAFQLVWQSHEDDYELWVSYQPRWSEEVKAQSYKQKHKA